MHVVQCYAHIGIFCFILVIEIATHTLFLFRYGEWHYYEDDCADPDLDPTEVDPANAVMEEEDIVRAYQAAVKENYWASD